MVIDTVAQSDGVSLHNDCGIGVVRTDRAGRIASISVVVVAVVANGPISLLLLQSPAGGRYLDSWNERCFIVFREPTGDWFGPFD